VGRIEGKLMRIASFLHQYAQSPQEWELPDRTGSDPPPPAVEANTESFFRESGRTQFHGTFRPPNGSTARGFAVLVRHFSQ